MNRIIEERVNIVDVVRRYVKLQPSGRRHTGLCPFHKEKTPSFGVNEERQFYHCFGCGAHGNALTFLMNIENLSFREAVRKIGADFGIRELLQEQESPEAGRAEEERRLILAANRLAALFFHRKLSEGGPAAEYLAGRGIAPDTIKKFGLGWIGEGDELVSFLRKSGVSSDIMEKSGLARIDQAGRIRSFFYERIMIPVVNQRRQVVGFGGRIIGSGEPKYLNTAETPVFLKRSSLFGLNLLRDGLKEHRFVIVTEGYFDVISLHAHGFATAVAALGTAVTPDHLKLLERFGVPVVMLFDGDAAGRAAMRRVLELELPEKLDLRIAFIESPDGKEDPDSLVRRPDGRERMTALLDGARDITQHYIEELVEQALRDTAIPRREAAKDEMVRLISRFPANRRVEYLAFFGELPRRLRAINADEAEQLRRDVEKRLHQEKRRAKGRFSGAEVRREEPPRHAGAAVTATPYRTLLRELLLLAATHRALIPALDGTEAAFLAQYEEGGERAALLAAHDGDDDDSLHAVATRLVGGDETLGALARMDEESAQRRFRGLFLKLRIAEIDRVAKDLFAEAVPEAVKEIQRLKQEKDRLSKELVENATAN